jgi:hypothetical protein
MFGDRDLALAVEEFDTWLDLWEAEEFGRRLGLGFGKVRKMLSPFSRRLRNNSPP